MSREALDRFGRFLMNGVRDRAIRHWDMVLRGQMKDDESQRLYSSIITLSPEARAIVSEVVPKIVDTSLNKFLQSLDDEDDIQVAVDTESGRIESISDDSDGLAGELYSEHGWFRRFSDELQE